MRNVLAIAACFAALTTAANASSAEITKASCVVEDGSQVSIMARNGNVAVNWAGEDWQRAFGKVEGNDVIVTTLGNNGVVVLVWNIKTNAAGIAIKNDTTGKVSEYRARCSVK